MAVKQGNKVVQITLTPFHQKKLALISEKTNLSYTAIIQRWIEGHNLFDKFKEFPAGTKKGQE